MTNEQSQQSHNFHGLQAIIGRVLYKLGQVEGRTRLMKLLYLIDLKTAQRLGKAASGAKWFSYAHGPFSREVLNELASMNGSVVRETASLTPYGDLSYRYSLIENGSQVPTMDDAVRVIVDDVVSRWGRRPLREILDHVYETPEFQKTSPCQDIVFTHSSP